VIAALGRWLHVIGDADERESALSNLLGQLDEDTATTLRAQLA
jgi:hypothetical protein